jgi:hypothetical protein
MNTITHTNPHQTPHIRAVIALYRRIKPGVYCDFLSAVYNRFIERLAAVMKARSRAMAGGEYAKGGDLRRDNPTILLLSD